MISDAFDVCCPGTLLNDFTTTGPTLDRYTLAVEHSATEEITLSLELLYPQPLGAGLRRYLLLEAMMPGPGSFREMEMATSDARRTTSPAQVNSQHPAALPAEDAAAPPEVCTGSPNPSDSPPPVPDLGGI